MSSGGLLMIRFVTSALICMLPFTVFSEDRTSAQQHSPTERTANGGNVILSGVPEIPKELSARLAPYQNTRSATFGTFSSKRAMFITTRFGSVPQIHRVDMPGGARHQLTFGAEPIRWVVGRPMHEELLYSSDEGGAEAFQLFLFDPVSGSTRRLTDGRSQNMGGVWNPEGTHLAFTSTKRDGKSNDIWILPVDKPGAARMALKAPDGTFWAAADWIGDRLLIANHIAATDTRIHVQDIPSGRMKSLIGGGDAPAAYRPLAFDRDGRGVFLLTEANSELVQLAWIPTDGGRIQFVTKDLPWDVEVFALSRDRKRAAFTTNESGTSQLYLMDAQSHDYRRVEALPKGQVSSMDFSHDGRSLAITISSAASPDDVYTLSLGRRTLEYGTVTRWTFSEVGGLDASRFVTPSLIEARSFDGRMIPALVYKPRGKGPFPVIVHIHGGPEGQARASFNPVIQSWMGEFGIAVVAPNVRGSSGYGKTYLTLDDGFRREDAVRDIGAILDWIKTQADFDSSRVMVYGGSSGGYMVLASLMHYSDRLAGGVSIVGISDFTTFLENTAASRRDVRRAEYGDERQPEVRAFFDRISPLRNARRIAAPLLVLHGENDPRVPSSQAHEIVRQVRAQGTPVWFVNALNEGHGFARKENQDLVRDVAALFIEKYLLRR
jgi:acetyl esterase/lipase